MFFPITEEENAVLLRLPYELKSLSGEFKGISFTMSRRTYGQTLVRLVATSPKSKRRFELSIGLAFSLQSNEPMLRVDFVKRFHPGAGHQGSWLSPFNENNALHQTVIDWACNAFVTALATWVPELFPPAAPEPSATEVAVHVRKAIPYRNGTTYATQAGKLVVRRGGPVKASVVGGTPAEKEALARIVGLH